MKIDVSPECVDEIFMAELENLINMPTDNLTHPEDIEIWDKIKAHAKALKEVLEP